MRAHFFSVFILTLSVFRIRIRIPTIPAPADNQPKKTKEVIEVQGEILESLPSATFRVRLDAGHTILAVVSGRMRKNHIKILPGDSVTVHLSPYDVTRGRIVRRG